MLIDEPWAMNRKNLLWKEKKTHSRQRAFKKADNIIAWIDKPTKASQYWRGTGILRGVRDADSCLHRRGWARWAWRPERLCAWPCSHGEMADCGRKPMLDAKCWHWVLSFNYWYSVCEWCLARVIIAHKNLVSDMRKGDLIFHKNHSFKHRSLWNPIFI